MQVTYLWAQWGKYHTTTHLPGFELHPTWLCPMNISSWPCACMEVWLVTCIMCQIKITVAVSKVKQFRVKLVAKQHFPGFELHPTWLCPMTHFLLAMCLRGSLTCYVYQVLNKDYRCCVKKVKQFRVMLAATTSCHDSNSIPLDCAPWTWGMNISFWPCACVGIWFVTCAMYL